MRAAKLIASNLLLLGGAALALELVFGNWLQQNPAKRIPEIARQAGRTHTFRTNSLTGEDVEVKFHRNQEGFRGKQNDTGLRQILVIGGSTAIGDEDAAEVSNASANSVSFLTPRWLHRNVSH